MFDGRNREKLKKCVQQLKKTESALVQCENEMRESREQFSVILQNLPVLICSYLPSGEIIFVNKAYCDYFNKTVDELTESLFLSLIPEADCEKVMRNISSLTPRSPTQTHEHRAFAPDGRIRWHQWTNRALFDDQGRAIRFESTGQDITRRKQAEAALKKSEKRLIEAQKLAKTGHYVLDIKAGRWESSPELNKIFGIDEDFKKNIESWIQLVHPDDRKDVQDYFRDEALTHLNKFDKRYRIVDANTGQEKWVHGIGEFTYDDNNTPVEMLGTIQDITSRVNREKERDKLIKDLRDALEKVKVLSGLIPICSNCKKIRDDQGYWNNIETYIQNHSDALFSHSICSECADALYGREAWYFKGEE